jgi:hypothetical protein
MKIVNMLTKITGRTLLQNNHGHLFPHNLTENKNKVKSFEDFLNLISSTK